MQIKFPNLVAEFEHAASNLKGYAQHELSKAGISRSVKSKLPYGAIGFVKAVTDGPYFIHDPRRGGPFFVLATAVLPGGIIEELVAFTPDCPRHWWRRTGYGEYLGDPFSSIVGDPFGSIQHRDITRFLQDGANGFVALNEIDD